MKTIEEILKGIEFSDKTRAAVLEKTKTELRKNMKEAGRQREDIMDLKENEVYKFEFMSGSIKAVSAYGRAIALAEEILCRLEKDKIGDNELLKEATDAKNTAMVEICRLKDYQQLVEEQF